MSISCTTSFTYKRSIFTDTLLLDTSISVHRATHHMPSSLVWPNLSLTVYVKPKAFPLIQEMASDQRQPVCSQCSRSELCTDVTNLATTLTLSSHILLTVSFHQVHILQQGKYAEITVFFHTDSFSQSTEILQRKMVKLI